MFYTIIDDKASLRERGGSYNQEEPNSDIQERYFWMSPLETDLLHLDMASMKSCLVTGRSNSSFASCLICSGLRPVILRRIDIIDASLKYGKILNF